MNIWTPLWGLHELKESTEKYKLFDLVKHHAIIYLSVKKPRRISWIYFGTTENTSREEEPETEYRDLMGEYNPLSNYTAIDNAMGYVKDLFVRDDCERDNPLFDKDTVI